MTLFQFKHFSVQHTHSAMKVGTDAMILGALSEFSSCQRILDIGTGTGILALIVAQRFSPDLIDALEIEEKACLDASINFSNNPFPTHIHLIHGNAKDFTATEKYDGIISNPPFFEGTYLSGNPERDAARHSHEFDFDALTEVVRKNLSTSGKFWCIIPYLITNPFTQLAEKKGLNLHRLITVFGKPETPVRSICCFQFNKPEQLLATDFTIRDEKGNYTAQYIRATIDLHDRAL